MAIRNAFVTLILCVVWAAFTQPVRAQDSIPTDTNVVAAVDSFPDTLVPVTVPPETVVIAMVDSSELRVEAEFSDDGPQFFSLKSPYHAILSHLYFLQDDSYHADSAAMTLYMKDQKGASAQKLAIMLKQYYDAAGYWIDLDIIPQDPNYVDSLSRKHKYQVIPEVPEIFVYKKGDRWVYSYTTIKNIERLHRSVYPFGTLDWLPDWMHGKMLGLKIWQWFGILLFLFLTVIIHRALTFALTLILKRFLDRIFKGGDTREFFWKIARPISLLILFYILAAYTPNLQLPIAVNKWVQLAFRIMIPVFYMLIGLHSVNLLMVHFAKRAEKTEGTMDDQLVPLLKNLFKAIIVIAFIAYTLTMLKVDVTALVGGVAFGSLALALAAQDTVKNLFGSLLIFVDRPFQIGDWVIIDGNEGVVEEVSVRSTRIRTFANSIITIPNGNIASTAINNMGARAYRRFVTRVGVTYDTPPHVIETFVEGIRKIIKNHPTTRKDYFEVAFNEMGDSALLILIYTFFEVPSWTQELAGRQELLLAIMRLADDLGVGFAFPTQTLHIE
ncbi:MAG: mechanosensitive ion channel family protein, partial [Bacteroidota bacterium]